MIMTMITNYKSHNTPSNSNTPRSNKLILSGSILTINIPNTAGNGGIIINVSHRGTRNITCLHAMPMSLWSPDLLLGTEHCTLKEPKCFPWLLQEDHSPIALIALRSNVPQKWKNVLKHFFLLLPWKWMFFRRSWLWDKCMKERELRLSTRNDESL